MESKLGRPSDYSQTIVDTICNRMANGESLRQICRDESMPCRTSVLKWLREHGDFAVQYARARQLLLEYWEDEQVDIADDGSNDWIDREVKGGRTIRVLDAEHVQRSQLRINTRKWLMSKLAPRKYGEKLDLNVAGQAGAPPIQAVSMITSDPIEAARVYQRLVGDTDEK
jgi:hypothetical protein